MAEEERTLNGTVPGRFSFENVISSSRRIARLPIPRMLIARSQFLWTRSNVRGGTVPVFIRARLPLMTRHFALSSKKIHAR